MPKVEVPSLDGLWEDELRELIPSLKEIHPLLGHYAEHKAEAMRLRAAGNIVIAMELEHQCDRIYGRLPEDLRW